MLYLRAAAAMTFPVTVDVLVPAWLLRASDAQLDLDPLRALGVPLIVAGAALLIDSVFLRFAREGKGTLVPIDPPRFVVRGGAYQLVRNPMYVANVTLLVGVAILFASWLVLGWAVVMLVVFHLFSVAYEEPALRREFGDDYEAYRRSVGRWIPRRSRRSP